MNFFKKKKKKAPKKKFDDKAFEVFLNVTFGNDEGKKKAMRKLDKNAKRKMYNEWEKKKGSGPTDGDIKGKPQFFVMELSTFNQSGKSEHEKAQVMNDLYVNLRTNNYSWVQEFTKLKGFPKLFQVFVMYNAKLGHKTPYEKDIIKNCVLSTVLLIDSSKEGFNQFVNTPNSVREFAHALSSEDSEVRWKVLYMLTAVAIKSDDLFDLVLDAMQNVKLIRREKHTFEIIVVRLKQDTKYENKLYCLTFLNVMIAKPKSMLTKHKILKDLEEMGIDSIIQGVEKDLIRYQEDEKDVQAKQITHSVNNQIQLLKEALKNYRNTKDDVFQRSDDIHQVFDKLLLRIGDNYERKTYVNVLLHNVATRMEKGIDDSQWEELLDTSSGKTSNLILIDRNKKLQSTLSAMKLQYDADRIKFSKERIASAESKVKLMKYLKDLKKAGSSIQTPRYDDNNPVTKSLYELVTSIKKHGATGSTNAVESQLEQVKMNELKQELNTAKEENQKLKTVCASMKLAIDKIKEQGGTVEKIDISSIPDVNIDMKPEEMTKLLESVGGVTIKTLTEGGSKKEGDEGNKDEDKKEGDEKKEEEKTEEDNGEQEMDEDAPPPPGFDDDMPPPPGFDDDMPPPPGFDDDMPPPPGFDDDMPPPPGMEPDEPKWRPPSLPDWEPTKKMKVFHWDMLRDEDLEPSIWIESGLCENLEDKVKIKQDEIEELFQSVVRKRKGPAKEIKEKPQSVCLLTPKRQQNLSIFCARLRFSNNELVQKLFSMDEGTFNIQLLSGFKRNAPTPEEIQAEKEYSGDVQVLDISDKFIRAMMVIPRFLPRIETWLFKLKFFEIISGLEPSMDIVIDGCNQLVESDNWKKLLQIILAIGNFINGANKKKRAHGFKLRTLDKLATMKSQDRKHSLLSYIIQFITEKEPQVNGFIDDLQKLAAANRVDIKGLPDELGKLEKQRDKIKNEIEQNEKVGNSNDQYAQVMKKFMETCSKVIDDLNEKFKKMNEVLENLAIQYGENKTTFPKDPSDFIARIVGFCDKYKREIDQIAKRKLKEERRLKREAMRKNRKAGGAPASIRRQPKRGGDSVLSGMKQSLFSGQMIKNMNRGSRKHMPPSAILGELSSVVMARGMKNKK